MAGEFYKEFKDKVVSSAQKRGASRAEWDDVLLVSADAYETKAVLSDQGVSTSGIRRDLAYSVHFGKPQLNETSESTTSFQSIHDQAIESLLTDVTVYTKSQEFIMSSEENRTIAATLLGFLTEYVQDREIIVENTEGARTAHMKARILEATVNTFVSQFTPALPVPTVPEYWKAAAAEANRQFAIDVLGKFVDFTMGKSRMMGSSDQALLTLEIRDEAERAQGGSITPFQIINTVEQAAGPFIKYLLHRNGLLTPDDYTPPCKMPDSKILDHGLEALSYAKTLREKTVRPVHLLPSLLRDSIITHLIMDLDEAGDMSKRTEQDYFMVRFGGRASRDFIRFHTAVGNAISPKTGGERFRYNLRITDEIKQFLAQAETVVDKGDELYAEARILGALFRADEQAKQVLLAAGLTGEHLDNWSEAITCHQRKREETRRGKPEQKEEKKEKVEGEFKISDRELKDLMDEYATDLTKLALEGKIDPVIGRNEELYQMMRTLLQRGRSNPLLLGESGVGKTALFCGLAQVIASGRAPKSLIGAQIIMLDLSAMNSGAMYRGQFEGRLLPIIQGVAERNAKGDKPPIILCIDELHAAFMAGTASGTPGAGELLKPYLTRGELSIVGATTQRDYAKYIAIDTALDRRFQTIFIDEPGFAETVEIVKGLKDQFTSHHQLQIEDFLIELIVKLSSRYLPNQKQPDKAIMVLDAALARAKITEKDMVDKTDVYATIAAEAKIDPKFLLEGDEERYLKLKTELPRQVLGQPNATLQIAGALITAKADLQDPRKPLGVFMLLGPTGVGKTETARALSRLLHGSEDNLIRIDMSDFMERHEASKLFGAPPGYIGYGEEGILTGAVRRQPYSVVVLDEIEKAHPEVLKQFLQIFEEGEKVDAKGQKVSFRNTIILMTSNLGAQSAVAEAEGEAVDPQSDEWRKITEPIYNMVAKSTFAPEFLNRIDSLIVYRPLSRDVIRELVQNEVQSLSDRLREKYGLRLGVSPEVSDILSVEGYKPEYGARELKRVVKQQLTQPLAGWILERRAQVVKNRLIRVTGLNSNFDAEVVEETSVKV